MPNLTVPTLADKRSRIRQCGFTLVELLVAISILAIVAVLGWRGLDGIVRARIALTEQLEQTRGLQLAFAQMQSDCAHITSTSSMPNRPRVVEDKGRLFLVRTVFADDQPSRLQVVVYQLKEGVLTRRESTTTRDLNVLDALWQSASINTDTAQPVVLQKGVQTMTARLWVNDGGGWRPANEVAAATQVMIRDANGNFQPAGAGNTAVNGMTASGLEVVLQLQGSSVPMTKVFLLGPV